MSEDRTALRPKYLPAIHLTCAARKTGSIHLPSVLLTNEKDDDHVVVLGCLLVSEAALWWDTHKIKGFQVYNEVIRSDVRYIKEQKHKPETFNENQQVLYKLTHKHQPNPTLTCG